MVFYVIARWIFFFEAISDWSLCFIGIVPMHCTVKPTCEQYHDGTYKPKRKTPVTVEDFLKFMECSQKIKTCDCPPGYKVMQPSGEAPFCYHHPSQKECPAPCRCNGKIMKVRKHTFPTRTRPPKT